MHSYVIPDDEEKKKLPIGGILLLVATIAILWGGWTIYKHPSKTFVPHSDDYSGKAYVHRVGSADFVPPADLWSLENISRYYSDGVGIKNLVFRKVLLSGTTIEQTFTMPQWNSFEEEHDNNKRQDAVNASHDEFNKLVAWLNSPQTAHRKVLVVVDESGKIGAEDSQLIKERLSAMKLVESVRAGDGLSLKGCHIGASRFTNCEDVEIPEGSARQASEVSDFVTRMSAERKGTESTSLAEGLANILTPLADAKSLPEEIAVFSDGVENDPETTGVNLYKQKDLLQKANWGTLSSKLEARKKIPSLTGVTVQWFGPRRGTGQERELIDNSLAFWKEFLSTSKNANVHTFYE